MNKYLKYIIMIKSKMFVIFSIFILSTYFDESMADNSPCGDWEQYKEDKCFKIFDKIGLQTYADAEKICREQENSSNLISIGFLEEQEYINNFLKTHKIVDYAWIGLHYINNKYKWVDDTNFGFTNWIEGSPKNKTDHCTQLQSDETSFGKWSDVLCNKKNLVVCQKMQTWSLSHLQKIVLNAIKNPLPIGFIYVQLPKEKSPTEIWPWMAWNDVSNEYAGVFFRVGGGQAKPFGQVQEDNAPRLAKVESCYACPNPESNLVIQKGETSSWIQTGAWDQKDKRELRFYMSPGEVRPRNMAIRIWKRTQ